MAWLAALAVTLCANAFAEDRAVLRITNDSRHEELLLDFGPFQLPPGPMQHHGMEPNVQLIRLPVAMWLQGYEVELLDRNGKPVPKQLLHHVNFILPERRELFANVMQRLGAAGEETGPVKLPAWLGVHLDANTPLLVSLMLHNPTRQAFNDVFLHVRMPYKGPGSGFHPISVQPFYLDAMPLSGEHTFDLPPGRSEKSWEARPSVSGRILGISGHLHKYATELRIDDLTENRTIWKTRPVFDAEKNISAMPQDFFLFGMAIDAGHAYRVSAVYDNPTGRPIPDGAMGAIGGVFRPARGKPWPKVNKKDEEYQRDVRIFAKGALDGTGQQYVHAHAH